MIAIPGISDILNFLENIFNSIGGLANSVYDILNNLPGYVLALIWAFVQCAAYPILAAGNYVNQNISMVISHMIELKDNLMSIFDVLTEIFTGVFGVIVSATMFNLMIACIFLVIVLRCYYFLKDISIFGWKI